MAGLFGNNTSALSPLITGALSNIRDSRDKYQALKLQKMQQNPWTALHKKRNPLVGALAGTAENLFNPETQEKVKMARAANTMKEWMQSNNIDPVKDRDKILEQTMKIATDFDLPTLREKAYQTMVTERSARTAAEMAAEEHGWKGEQQENKNLETDIKVAEHNEKVRLDYWGKRLAVDEANSRAAMKQADASMQRALMSGQLSKEVYARGRNIMNRTAPVKIAGLVQKILPGLENIGPFYDDIDQFEPGNSENIMQQLVTNVPGRVSTLVQQRALADMQNQVVPNIDETRLTAAVILDEAAKMAKVQGETFNSSEMEKIEKALGITAAEAASILAEYEGGGAQDAASYSPDEPPFQVEVQGQVKWFDPKTGQYSDQEPQ